MTDTMMQKTTNIEHVKEFHKLMDMDRNVTWDKSSSNLMWFRFKLIQEEFNEVQESLWNMNESFLKYPNQDDAKAHVLKELSDLLYVIYGFAVTFGLDMDEAFKRVHDSNISKLVDGKPLKNKDGKVLKGPFYKKPFLNDLV